MIIDTGVSGSVSDFYFEGGQLASEARGHLFAPYVIFSTPSKILQRDINNLYFSLKNIFRKNIIQYTVDYMYKSIQKCKAQIINQLDFVRGGVYHENIIPK
jgi:hypothetical protein